MSGLPVELCETFWRRLDPGQRSQILRDLKLAPDGSYVLSMKQQRHGLLAAASERKITKLRREIKALLPPVKRGPKPAAPAMPAITLEQQEGVVALVAAAGFAFRYPHIASEKDWQLATKNERSLADLAVQAVIKAGWLKLLKFDDEGVQIVPFEFVVPTAVGLEATGAILLEPPPPAQAS